MCKFFQALLVAIYLLLTGYSLFALLKLWGLPVSNRVTLGCYVGWAAYCFSSAYLWTGLSLVRLHVRRPIKAEEDKLIGCFQEVQQKAGIMKTFQLLIQEDMGCNAFATGIKTIVVSRGLLDKVTPEELKGILAHELGHLQSKDCIFSAAFLAARFPPQLVAGLCEKGMRILTGGFIIPGDLLFSIRRFFNRGAFFRIRMFLWLAALIGLSFWLHAQHLLLPMVLSLSFPWTFWKVTRLFSFLWKMTNRFIEYKRDEYACQLGYGPALRLALHKLTLDEPQIVSLYETLMRENHPVVYNRIRRLEKLEGIR